MGTKWPENEDDVSSTRHFLRSINYTPVVVIIRDL